MNDATPPRRVRITKELEGIVGDVNKVVHDAVSRSTEAAGSVGDSIKETLKDTLHGVRSTRDSVVMVRVNKESLTRLDDLVESGLSSSRSEAAAFLIVEGARFRRDLFERIAEQVGQIRVAKEELRRLLEDEGEDPSTSPPTDTGA